RRGTDIGAGTAVNDRQLEARRPLMWGRSARRLGLTLAAIAFAVACNKTAEKPAEPPPPPEPEVAKATDAQVTSLSEMAVEYEKLEQTQAATNQQMGQL